MKFLKMSISKCYRKGYKFLFLLILTLVLVTLYPLQMSHFNPPTSIKNGKEIQNIEFSYDLSVSKGDLLEEMLVHIDLKGAPPKISYLLKFIPFIKKLGATGLLIEYEDMFPYHSELENITALNAYTPSDIASIIATAEMNNLSVIPLIPTFSHFEFVLKLEQYRQFREIDSNPYNLCPSQENVYPFLQKMIDQVLEIHNTSKYVHIGCDEPEFIGVCPKCRTLKRNNKYGKDDIYFDHVRKLSEYIMQNHVGIRPIIWADKLIKSNSRVLLRHRIPELLDPMLWNYESERNKFPSRSDMNSLSKLFKNIWIANAFKGATGSAKIITDPEFHLKNTKGWIEFVTEWKTKVNIKGIAITGWQRYNHFTVLCELLPVGIPSLALNLQILIKGQDPDYTEIKHLLNCTGFVPTNLEEINDWAIHSKLDCDFPGFQIYHVIHSFYNELYHFKASLATLATENFVFCVINNASNPSYLKSLNIDNYKQRLLELDGLENQIRNTLNEIYDEHTIREWIMTYVAPLRMHFESAINAMSTLSSVKVWPRRPLLNNVLQTRQFFNKICNKNNAWLSFY